MTITVIYFFFVHVPAVTKMDFILTEETSTHKKLYPEIISGRRNNSLNLVNHDLTLKNVWMEYESTTKMSCENLQIQWGVFYHGFLSTCTVPLYTNVDLSTNKQCH